MHAACTVPGFEQETLRKFIAGGFLERHIARLRVVYRARLAALPETVQALNLGSVAPCGAGYRRVRRCADDILYLPRGLFFYLRCFTLDNFQFRHPL